MSKLEPYYAQMGQLSEEDYDRLAWEYYHTLPMEHFMESTPHSTQREITLASLALLRQRRSDVQYFNELLVQYLHEGRVRRVTPDNMIVLDIEEKPRQSFAVEREANPPLMMFEYVSTSSKEKDFGVETDNEDTSHSKYEKHLQTPYYLVFDHLEHDLRVFHLDEGQYVRMEPDGQGRILIKELDLQVGLHEGWVRYWHQGELLPIPEELQTQMNELLQEMEKLSAKYQTLGKDYETLGKDYETLGKKNEVLETEMKKETEKAVETLRRLVKLQAKTSGRDDILQNIAAASQQQLEQWAEMLEDPGN